MKKYNIWSGDIFYKYGGGSILTYTKGQLISECLFDVLNFPKSQISAQESKGWSNHTIQALYNVFNTLNT